MQILENIILCIVGFGGGLAVAAGEVAFITILGIVPRMADRLGLAEHTRKFETLIALGAFAGGIISVYQWNLPMGVVGMAVFGLFSGVFVGLLLMALAETLKILPILCLRSKLEWGLPVVVISIAIGKALGSFYQLFICGG